MREKIHLSYWASPAVALIVLTLVVLGLMPPDTAVLHVHAVAEECSIVRLTASIDKKTGVKSKKAPMFVKVRLFKLCAESGMSLQWSVLLMRFTCGVCPIWQSGAVIACIIECEQPVRAMRVSCSRTCCPQNSIPVFGTVYGRQVCIETFDASPQLGRFTLRDEGKTIGIGKCLTLLDADSKSAD